MWRTGRFQSRWQDKRLALKLFTTMFFFQQRIFPLALVDPFFTGRQRLAQPWFPGLENMCRQQGLMHMR